MWYRRQCTKFNGTSYISQRAAEAIYTTFMEALRRSAPVPITFEAMAADTDGYFSADHQKIAIRQGMSEVQTVSATVHEIAHSKLHDPKKYEMLPSWKVVQESEGGTKHDFKLDFATKKEAEQFASDMDWRCLLYTSRCV